MRSRISRVLRGLGIQVVKSHDAPLEYDHEDTARKAIARVRSHTMVSHEPLVSLYQQVRHCELNGLAGDFVECGVWKAGSVGLMTLANMEYGRSRRDVHLFDIFDDICEPDPEHDGEFVLANMQRLSGVDKSTFSGKLRSVAGTYDSHGGHGTVEIAEDLLVGQLGYERSFLHFHRGWFQDTVPSAAKSIDAIAILRLDGDFYASTKVCLEHLYDKVVPGGFVILDDYGTREGCRKATDEFRELNGIRSFIHHVNQDCRYWIKE